MKFFTHFSLRNPVAIVLLIVLVAVGGVYSSVRLNQEQLPEVVFPGVMVQAIYPGAAPSEVQSEVSAPLENALRGVEGARTVTSQSANSVAVLMVEFNYGEDIKEKRAAVQEAISNVRLPAEVEKPEVVYFSTTNDPIMFTSVRPNDGVTEEAFIRYVKETLIPQLEAIEGVTGLQTTGLPDDGIYVRLNAPRMTELGVTYDQVMMSLQANNLSVPLGEVTIDRSNLPVFVQGKLDGIAALEDLIVSPLSGVKLGDIASLQHGKEDQVLNMTNGVPSVSLNVLKSSAANTVKVSDEVLKLYEEAEQEGIVIPLIIYDRAAEVKESVNTLAREGALGALFASLLILFFLRNFRATLIAVVSIPLSMLIAMICLKNFTDVTLNIMTLGGLAVATGRVVDDSIVVIENIVRRLQKEKVSRDLIQESTLEVGRAIVSSTLTTVAVFAPMGLMQGMTGEFARPFALTVAFALLASLLVALTVVPLMAWVLLRRQVPKEHGESKLSHGYKRVLKWSLNHKFAVLALASVLFASSLVPIFSGALGVVFLPETENKYLFADFQMPRGTDVQAVKQETDKIDAVIRRHEDVLNTNLTVGGSAFGDSGSHTAFWFIGLVSEANLDAFIDEIYAQVDIPGEARFDLFKDDMGGSGAISVTVTGRTNASIREGTEQIMAMMRDSGNLANINSNLQDGTKGIAIEVRQADAAMHGLSAAQASSMLRPYLAELGVGRMNSGASSHDLYVSLDGESLQSVTDIAALQLATPLGTIVAVSDIAEVKEVQLPSTLQRKNGSEFATVTAKFTAADAAAANRELVRALEQLELPDGVTFSLGGSNEDSQQMMTDMLLSMVVAVGLVYIVMVITFREGRAPLAILFSLPFALFGGLAGTMIAGEPISVSSLIGFLMLIGIVVTNAIVLIERVQQQIERGLTIREALIEASGTRLRPILMTAIATICALTPLAIGLGSGSIISSGLAVVVIGGLASSTLLTLVVVPVMYELLYFKRSRKERAAVLQPVVEAAA